MTLTHACVILYLTVHTQPRRQTSCQWSVGHINIFQIIKYYKCTYHTVGWLSLHLWITLGYISYWTWLVQHHQNLRNWLAVGRHCEFEDQLRRQVLSTESEGFLFRTFEHWRPVHNLKHNVLLSRCKPTKTRTRTLFISSRCCKNEAVVIFWRAQDTVGPLLIDLTQAKQECLQGHFRLLTICSCPNEISKAQLSFCRHNLSSLVFIDLLGSASCET